MVLSISEPVPLSGRIIQHRPTLWTVWPSWWAVLISIPWTRRILQWSPPVWCALPEWGAPFLRCASLPPLCWSVAACHHIHLWKGRARDWGWTPFYLEIPGSWKKDTKKEGSPDDLLEVPGVMLQGGQNWTDAWLLGSVITVTASDHNIPQTNHQPKSWSGKATDRIISRGKLP